MRRPVDETVVEPLWPIAKVLPRRALAKKELVDVPAVEVKVEREVRPESTESVPVNEAAEEMVWPLIAPEVITPVLIEPRTEAPAFKAVAKRLVLEATVE